MSQKYHGQKLEIQTCIRSDRFLHFNILVFCLPMDIVHTVQLWHVLPKWVTSRKFDSE
jgi:hypothetical protein